MEKATFAAGCFWGIQAIFDRVKGVESSFVGYTGGNIEDPTYEEVCTDKTNHAEVVLLEFDPEKVSYKTLLRVFWDIHDPTSLNKQGPDSGTQYRSAIFYHTEEQRILAEKSKQELDASDEFDQPVVTEIVPATTFYKAEEYHQKYFEKNGPSDDCPTCSLLGTLDYLEE